MADEKDVDIHATLTAAYDEQEKAAETPVETPEKPAEPGPDAVAEPKAERPDKAGRLHDEKGKFAKKDVGVKADAEPAEAKPDAVKQADIKADIKPAETPKIEAPKHWAAKDKDVFKQAPAEIQKWLLDRSKAQDADYTKRVQGLQPYQEMAKVAQAWNPYLTQRGLQPHIAFDALLQAEWKLRHGTASERKAHLQYLAKHYDIPLDEQAPAEQEYVDPTVKTVQDQLAALRAQVEQSNQSARQQMESWQRRQQENQYNGIVSQIDSFASEADQAGQPAHPYFEEVADEMAALVQAERAAGRKPDLKALYEKAVWSNPDLRQRLLALQQEEAVKRAKDQAKTREDEARKAAISITGAPNGASRQEPSSVGSADDDLRHAARQMGYLAA